MLTVSWFSSGVSSAVATKLSIMDGIIDRVMYIHIDDQHEDTMRFVKDCEAWFDMEIEIVQSPYKSVEAACLGAGGKGYIVGVAGAACTNTLKRKERIRWEWENDVDGLRYVWGIDSTESHRCDRLRDSMPNQEHVFPLVDRGYDKKRAHQILKASGIKRPAMYDMGYQNNNCIGCVKGGMAYWNRIRVDFPDVFDARAKMEREIGASCLRVTRDGESHSVYLDELDPSAGRDAPPVCEDCGIFCQLEALE